MRVSMKSSIECYPFHLIVWPYMVRDEQQSHIQETRASIMIQTVKLISEGILCLLSRGVISSEVISAVVHTLHFILCMCCFVARRIGCGCDRPAIKQKGQHVVGWHGSETVGLPSSSQEGKSCYEDCRLGMTKHCCCQAISHGQHECYHVPLVLAILTYTYLVMMGWIIQCQVSCDRILLCQLLNT